MDAFFYLGIDAILCFVVPTYIIMYLTRRYETPEQHKRRSLRPREEWSFD